MRIVSVGSGKEASDSSTGDAASSSLREPAFTGSDVRRDRGADLSGVRRQGNDGLNGFSKDAKST